MRNKKVIRCDSGESVSRTPDNTGRKLWAAIIIRGAYVEGGNCGFFKSVDEELDQKMEMTHAEQIKPWLEVIIGLLVVILLMLTIMAIKM
uniref:Uncharacterized protein n=1 Tax=Lactuca sativa TaxID=4236 RepID=A0A9R1VMF4_LACSA|nr:hypothetical protein LSAT_V11C400192190 [Lactuca sativa]